MFVLSLIHQQNSDIGIVGYICRVTGPEIHPYIRRMWGRHSRSSGWKCFFFYFCYPSNIQLLPSATWWSVTVCVPTPLRSHCLLPFICFIGAQQSMGNGCCCRSRVFLGSVRWEDKIYVVLMHKHNEKPKRTQKNAGWMSVGVFAEEQSLEPKLRILRINELFSIRWWWLLPLICHSVRLLAFIFDIRVARFACVTLFSDSH